MSKPLTAENKILLLRAGLNGLRVRDSASVGYLSGRAGSICSLENPVKSSCCLPVGDTFAQSSKSWRPKRPESVRPLIEFGRKAELRVYFGNAASILRMIRSAHCTALAINDSVLGLGFESIRSSMVFRCRATRIPATIASTRLRPSSTSAILTLSSFVRLMDSRQKNHTCKITCKNPVLAVLQRTGEVPDGL